MLNSQVKKDLNLSSRSKNQQDSTWYNKEYVKITFTDDLDDIEATRELLKNTDNSYLNMIAQIFGCFKYRADELMTSQHL